MSDDTSSHVRVSHLYDELLSIDSLSDESVKKLWNGDLNVDLKAVTTRKFTASLQRS